MNLPASSNLQEIIGLILVVSISSERLVEIIKGFFPWLNEAKTNTTIEGYRKAVLQLLAVFAGIFTAFLASPILADSLTGTNKPIGVLAIGLLASGGSAFWNAILTYVLQVKDLKKQEVQQSKNTTESSSAPDSFPNLNIGTEQVTSNECYDVEDK